MSYQILTLDVLSTDNTVPDTTTTLKLRVKQNGANYLVHKTLTIQKLNSRTFTACTKTRSQVSGGGRKPWKQKGTGRARAGSNRSPLWRGGGVTFGPKPKKIKLKINKKEKFLALQTLLLNKKDKIIALDKFDLIDYRTKNVNALIKKLNLSLDERILFVTKSLSSNFRIATRNLPLVTVTSIDQMDITKVLTADKIVFDSESVKYFDSKICSYYGIEQE